MAKKVYINDAALIASVQRGSAGVWRWRNKVLRSMEFQAKKIAPVNNPLNAVHRGGVVGTYKASFDKDKRGSNGYVLRGRLWNYSPHAQYVEYGRSGSSARQVFSWALANRVPTAKGGIPFKNLTGFQGKQYRQPGVVYTWYHTNAREGQHVLARAGRATARIHGANWINT